MCPALVKPPDRRKIQLQIVTVENKVNARTRVREVGQAVKAQPRGPGVIGGSPRQRAVGAQERPRKDAKARRIAGATALHGV